MNTPNVALAARLWPGAGSVVLCNVFLAILGTLALWAAAKTALS
jgi:hypothetical protein